MLKLLKLGAVSKDPQWQQLLENNKFIFMPIFNVDGVAYIEENWTKSHRIIPKRKNMDQSESCKHERDIGVDLNR